MFKEQVERCWKKPYGGIEAAKFEVEFNIKLKRDGTLEGDAGCGRLGVHALPACLSGERLARHYRMPAL